ncbi:hypothetical protein E0H49_37260 [Rhizobium leguminosarum bv. viciae]|nr:hypothetical protein E0H37_36705 [Rhizobium leguminosarum bv. viciae]TBY88035.1 hypothetical protein E0H49_37260 [Rhizobium leguminosarum bv. viciae]
MVEVKDRAIGLYQDRLNVGLSRAERFLVHARRHPLREMFTHTGLAGGDAEQRALEWPCRDPVNLPLRADRMAVAGSGAAVSGHKPALGVVNDDGH